MREERIKLNMSWLDMVMAVSEGNPGAATAIMECTNMAKVIDPASALAQIGPILLLDSYGIYGSNVWLLFKDCCRQSAVNMIAVLRAMQLGIIDHSEVKQAIASWGFGADRERNDARVAEILAAVRQRLPSFAALPETQEQAA